MLAARMWPGMGAVTEGMEDTMDIMEGSSVEGMEAVEEAVEMGAVEVVEVEEAVKHRWFC